MKNRSVPSDTVLPHIVYGSVKEAAEWLSRVFGFRECFRYGDPVDGIQMSFGCTYFMLAKPWRGRDSPARAGFCTQMLTVFVEDVDAHFARARSAGAKIVEEVNETFYGERQYGVEDLEGHRWIFAQHVRDVRPEEWGATVPDGSRE